MTLKKINFIFDNENQNILFFFHNNKKQRCIVDKIDFFVVDPKLTIYSIKK